MENILTCTVRRRADRLFHKLIDIITSWTDIDFNRIGLDIAAVIQQATADTSGHHSILNCWMGSVQPHCGMSATTKLINTCVWHLSILTINEETIPADPADIKVTHILGYMGILIVCGSPRIIQHSVFVAGVGLGIVWVFFDTGAKSILLKRCRCLNGA